MWLILAILASVFWGITYVLNEELFRQLSVPTTIAAQALAFAVLTLAVSAFTGDFRTDWQTVTSSRSLLGLLAAAAATSLIAELLIGFSISSKNATVAGLVEISYPLFIALFAYLFYRRTELSIGTIIGGALILAGVAVIYRTNA